MKELLIEIREYLAKMGEPNSDYFPIWKDLESFVKRIDEAAKAKKAKNADEAWKIQETYAGIPHGWIQWKGTDVCMDVYCKCGSHLHFDDYFVYHVKCLDCGTVYMCNGHVELIELEEEPADCVKEDSGH